jgi:dTDP-4-dehydrorhamnose 3,5-epimerase
MIFEETPLSGCYVIKSNCIKDERGWFSRIYCADEFKKINHFKPFVQFNHSFNVNKGTLRGMHFQMPPFSEVKLIRCISGSVYDVVIDLRKDSPTFLKHFGVILSPQNHNLIYVPEGFAHGFQTLEDETQLLYHHTEFYNSKFEDGFLYSDPLFSINWPMHVNIISDRDSSFRLLDRSFQGV